MTNKEAYLKACGFAVTQMIKKGSSSIALGLHSEKHPVTIVEWKDVLGWIDKEIKDETNN